MALEDDYTNDPQVTSALWQQYYANQSAPSGFELNQNQIMADALRGYGQDSYLNPVTYMPGYEDTLTRKLLEKKDSGLTTTQPRQQGGMQMPNMMGMGRTQTIGEVSGIPANYQLGTGTVGNKYAASQGYEPLNHAEYNNVAGTIDDAGGIESVGGGGNTQWFGNGGQLGGGWVPAIGGALAGYNQGAQNYRDDPNMWSGKDGYGKYHKDYRAEVGGGTLGGVLGWYGGPIGAAVAGPVVKQAHKVMEPATREVINFGDKVGGSGGALMLDPIGTVSSGKYSWGELGKGALFGPAVKWFKL